MNVSPRGALPALMLALFACDGGNRLPREAVVSQDFNCATPEGRAGAASRVSRFAKAKGFKVGFREDQPPMELFILSVEHGSDTADMSTLKDNQVSIAIFTNTGALERSSLSAVYAEMAASLTQCAEDEARDVAFH